MRFDKRSKIHKIPASGNYSAAWLETGKRRMLATNGRILAVVPVETFDDETDGLVCPDALAAALKAPRGMDASLSCNGHHGLPSGATMPRPDPSSMRIPPIDDILRDAGKGDVSLSLSVAELRRLADALGSETVTLRFSVETVKGKQIVASAIEVRPDDGIPMASGVLMPRACK